MSISQSFNDVRARARQGLVGMWAMVSSLNREGFGINQDPQAAQVTTTTVSDPGDNTDVTITINGVDVTHNTGTGEGAADIVDALAVAINAEPLVRGQVSATSDGVNLLTLTGLTPGAAFTATESSAALTTPSTTTTADTADPIPFGRAVISQGYRTDEGERLVAIALDDNFSYQVATLTIAFVDTAKLRVRVYEMRGAEKILLADVTETSATNRDTTIDALVAGLEAALPANTVSAAADNATATAIVFTAEVKGFEFAIEYGAGDEGASVPAISLANTTGPSEATSIHRALAGVSLYSSVDPTSTIGGTAGQYAGNAGVRLAQSGAVWVSNSQSPSEGDTVYVEMDDSASLNGCFYNTSSSSRVALAKSMARWERAGLVAADSLAALRLSL